jgi:HEPN superfamily Swt1-like protein
MTSDADHHLRSFGMSGFLITEELKGVETRYGIELGHVKRGLDDESQYYPQFEQAVRVEAARMSEHYEVFYCLETSIRKLMTDTLSDPDAEGPNWWNSARIPQAIKDVTAERLQKEIDSGVTQRSEKAIDYTTFGELSVIITNNWDLFETIFTSKKAVEKVMRDLNVLRGPIAHCCPITEDEVDRLRLAVKDWFRMMA